MQKYKSITAVSRKIVLLVNSIILTCIIILTNVPQNAFAGTTLIISPTTWNIIGLDSNSPATGPKDYPVGARICSSALTSNVLVNWVWDSTNANVFLRTGSLSTITIDSIAAGECTDVYFNVEVNPVAGAFDTAREYHITATDLSGTVSTPQPRELYVEHLISQNRNDTLEIYIDDVLVNPGDTVSFVVGGTYAIRLNATTATQGYEQIESFINFPNSVFEILSFNVSYSADTSAYVDNPNDKLYGDACLWDSDPTSLNYLSCIESGKAGGALVLNYVVKIISEVGSNLNLNTLLYDFSGSSFHYNADFSSLVLNTAVINPSNISIAKAFGPNPTNAGGTSVLTFTLTNPNDAVISGINFTDTLPSSMVVSSPPNANTSGCGGAVFSPSGGDTSLSFSDGAIAANSSCLVSVSVSVPAEGSYVNTSSTVKVNVDTDTGNSATDTLVVNTSPPSPAPVCGLTMAIWDFNLTVGTNSSPAYSQKSGNVLSADASIGGGSPGVFTGVIDATGNPANSWLAFGWEKDGPMDPATHPYFQFAIDTRNHSEVDMSMDFQSKSNGPDSLYLYYSTDGATFLPYTTPPTATLFPTTTFVNSGSLDFTGLTSTTGVTYFRIYGLGANTPSSGADSNIDNVTFTGCSTPSPATISKSFTPDAVAVNGVSTLVFTLSNSNSIDLTGATFSDDLPTGLEVASTPNASTTCTGTPIWAPLASETSLSFSGGTILAASSCTLQVDVLVTTSGPHQNVSGFLSTTEAGQNDAPDGYATDNLTAILPPSISKTFNLSTILEGGISTLTFTVTNPNQDETLTNITFSDTFPTSPGAMVVASTPNASTSACGTPTYSPGSGDALISFSNGTLLGGESCTVSVDITAPIDGVYANSSGLVSADIVGNGNFATDSLTVVDPSPAISIIKQVSTEVSGPWKSFISLPEGDLVYYRIIIENIGDVPLSPVSVTDPLVSMSGCSWSATLPAPDIIDDDHIESCVIGPVFAIAGSNPNTATAHGTYSSVEYTDTSTATYATTELVMTKSAVQDYFTSDGDVLNYNFNIENTGSVSLASPVTVFDDKATDESCPAVSTVGNNDSYFDPGESIICSATYTVTAADFLALTVTNNAYATADGVTSNTDSESVSTFPSLTIDKSHSGDFERGSTGVYTIIVSNDISVGPTYAPVTVNDVLPTGLTLSATPTGTGWACSGNAGESSLSCTRSDALASGSSYPDITVSVNIAESTVDLVTNTASVLGGGDPSASSDDDPTTVVSVADLEVTKTDSVGSIEDGGSTTYTLTLINNGPSLADNATISDPSVSGLNKISLGACSTGGSAICPAAGAGVGELSISNLEAGTVVIPTLPSGGSISFTVTVNLTASNGNVTNTFSAAPPAGTTDPSPGNATVDDTNAIINAVDDSGSTVDGITGGESLTNVLANDSLDGVSPIDLEDVNLTQISTTHANVTLNVSDGSVNVAAITPGGTYYVVYQICDALNPTICDTATVTVNVEILTIDAINDNGSTIDGTVGGESLGNVLTNDSLNDVSPVNLADVNLTQISTTHPNVNLDITDGSVDVVATTPDGTYTVTYQICIKINPSTCDTATVTVPVLEPQADLSITKSIDNYSPIFNETITFTITVTNSGPISTQNISIEDIIPNGYQYVGGSIGSDAGSTLANITENESSAPQLSWDIDQLDNGESVDLTYDVVVQLSGDFNNLAQITASDEKDPDSDPASDENIDDLGDSLPDDDEASATINPNWSDLSLSKIVDIPSPSVGDTVTFTITISNSGLKDATGVVVSDKLPDGYLFSSATPSQGSYDDSTGDWTVGSISVGASATLELAGVVKVSGNYKNVSQVIASDQSDPDSTPNNDDGDQNEDDEASATLSTTHVFDPPTSWKSADSNGWPIIVWRQVWINNGNSDAMAVRIEDPISNLNTYVPNSLVCDARGFSGTTYCGFNPDTNIVLWEGNIAADFGATNEADAVHKVIITFSTTIAPGELSVKNQAVGFWDENADGVLDYFDANYLNNNPVRTDDRSTASANDSTIATIDSEPIDYIDALPDSGFVPGVTTLLPKQPKDISYKDYAELWLEIPKLGVMTEIIGIPLSENQWDIDWLKDQAGYLQGTAFPTIKGNTAITGHITLSDGSSGPFAQLIDLRYGDVFTIHSNGFRYIYLVQNSTTVKPNDLSVLGDKYLDWVTLITCSNFNSVTDAYDARFAVQAVLIKIEINH